MLFNLEDLVNRHNDLDELVQPFSRKEIDNVINKMANDKAPGPDGFNGMFLKKCWHIIKGTSTNSVMISSKKESAFRPSTVHS